MNKLESKYQCSEFLEEYYSEGLFHPTECQILYTHKNAFERNDCLVIGEVYDDHDCLICYRKDEPEVWANSNYDNSFQKLSKTLKQFTEGWYQFEPKRWYSMNSDMNLKSIIEFYQINDKRYKWVSKPLINVLVEIIEAGNLLTAFAKAHKGILNISSTNGFASKPSNKMTTVQLDERQNVLKVFHKESFFENFVESKDFSVEDVSLVANSILNWIK